jgi:hypothetical protein
MSPRVLLVSLVLAATVAFVVGVSVERRGRPAQRVRTGG